MSFLVESPGDAARRSALIKMRIVATSLLGLALAIWLATLNLDHSGVWGYVNTASEAAMVGALADWFAVTAIFRHPLGLPIPHTALVKKRKDDLGRSLQEFVDDNFLTEEIARDRLEAAHVGQRLGRWLDAPEHRGRALREGVRVARVAVDNVQDEAVAGFVTDVVLPRLKEEPTSHILGVFLEGIVEDKAHRALIDLGVDELRAWLVDRPAVFAALLNERAPRWTPGFVDAMAIDWAYHQVLDWLADVRADDRHRAKLALDDLLVKLSRDLKEDPEVMARAEALKVRMLSHPQVGDTVVAVWGSIRTSLITAMEDPTSSLWTRGDAWLAEAGARLREDAELRALLEGRLGDIVAFFVNTYGDELAAVISHTVNRWDADEASQRIELFVGKDLQFIRINGTIVGALAGVAIHALSQVFS
ncbi:DUF445 domain-containing protein [Kribbia dieselivorans]|uniref:DUF445 domain-containing protein n=1 Tax=Kribbia dieselivorans TaxID=331526 RepID=UPI0008380972|nr:DUF445 domain-containing protein [Kribbia dieselivorans]